jgi:hypothetical protein
VEGFQIAMRSSRRLALFLACTLPVLPALAQSSSSSQTDPAQQNPPAQSSQDPGQTSVQARIRARREQRRATAIHDAYDHRWESYMQMGYLRFKPGPNLQRLTYYGWDTGLTRYYSPRLGINVDGRGYYGTAYVGLNPQSQGAFTRPAISQYAVMAGPTYSFYLQPKYSIGARVIGGWAHGNFSGDTNGIPPPLLGLYPDANTFAVSASVVGEMNISPSVAFRLAPEYYFSGFSSTMQASAGFTGGLIYRWGKQQ